MSDKWNGFRGTAKPMDDIDPGMIGQLIGVGEDEIRAFMEVESRGKGFDAMGRPIILFEPHIFWKELPAALRNKASAEGLAYPKWKPGAYKGDMYVKLKRAMTIHEDAALKACSWGLMQVLGTNHKDAGYETIDSMVMAMMEDEEYHLKAGVQFLISNNLDDELRELAALDRPTTAKDCQPLVRGYNGAGYKENKYDTKFAAAHNKWRGKADVELPGTRNDFTGVGLDEQVAMPSKTTEKLTTFEIQSIQRRLRDLGWVQVGKIDGKWGTSTTGALAAFQAEAGITVDGRYGPQTRDALAKGFRRPIAPARAATSVADLQALGSRTIDAASKVKATSNLAGIGGVGTLVFGALSSQFQTALDMIQPVIAFFEFIPWWAYAVLVIGVAIYLQKQATRVEDARVEDERKGYHVGLADSEPPATDVDANAPDQRGTAHTVGVS